MSADLAPQIEAAIHDRKAKRHGDKIDFLCVSCDDGTQAAACWEPKRDVWGCAKCGAGGTTRDLAKRLGIHVETPAARSQKSKIVATYDYRDEDGNLLFQVARMQPKAFIQRRPDGKGGWEWKGGEPTLYRLPELMKSTGRVYVVEGEKDVDNIFQRGGVATCNPGGASETGKSKWRAEIFNKYLAGRDVVILPDRDRAGDSHATYVATSLLGTAKSVRVLALPNLEWKSKRGPDVSDWFAGGAEFDELEELADACPEWEPPKEPTGLASFPEGDAGNAELFAHVYGDRVRYDHQRGRWLVWDRHRWGVDMDGQLWRWAVEAARARAKAAIDALTGDARERQLKAAAAAESTAKIEAMFKQARTIDPIADRGQAWDANPMLLGAENGIVNLSTGELRDGCKDDRVTLNCGIHVDLDATCPRWLQFLEEVFVDQEIIDFVQRMAGYCLTGSFREHVWFLCYGDGANGKSTFLETILYLLGGLASDSYAADTPADTLMKKGGLASIPADIAALVNKRFVICSESDNVSTVNTGRVKALTSGNPQTARFMRENFFTFVPVLKLALGTNYLPRVNDPTDGYWRRVILIPFLQKFEGDRRDLNLNAKLKDELPGILNWAIEGAVRWNKEGLRTPNRLLLATLAYRNESNPLGEWTLQNTIEDAQAEELLTALYKSYLGWAEREQIGSKETLGRNTFGRHLEAMGYKKVKRNNGVTFLGVRVRHVGEEQNVTESDVLGGSLDSSDVLDPPTRLISELYSSHENSTENRLENVTSSPGRCDCTERHSDPAACTDADWWQDDGEQWHCGVHHPPQEDISEWQ